MREFHKRIYPRQLPSKDYEDNLIIGNNLIEKSESRKQNQLQNRVQLCEKILIWEIINLGFKLIMIK